MINDDDKRSCEEAAISALKKNHREIRLQNFVILRENNYWWWTDLFFKAPDYTSATWYFLSEDKCILRPFRVAEKITIQDIRWTELLTVWWDVLHYQFQQLKKDHGNSARSCIRECSNPSTATSQFKFGHLWHYTSTFLSRLNYVPIKSNFRTI